MRLDCDDCREQAEWRRLQDQLPSTLISILNDSMLIHILLQYCIYTRKYLVHHLDKGLVVFRRVISSVALWSQVIPFIVAFIDTFSRDVNRRTV